MTFATRTPKFIGSIYLAAQLVDRVASLGVIVLIAALYGASASADTFFLASVVPAALGGVLGEPVARSFQTILVQETDDAAARRIAGAGLLLTGAALVGVTVVYAAIAAPFAQYADLGRVAVWLVLAVTALALGLSAYLAAVLTWREDYVWSALRFPIGSVIAVTLAGLVSTFTSSLLAVATAVCIGYVTAPVVLYARIARELGAGWGLGGTREAHAASLSGLKGRLGQGIAGGILGGQMLVVLERAFAAALAPGAVAILSYARGLASAPAILAQAIGAGRYPGLVRAEATGSESGDAYVRRGLLRGLGLTLLAGVIAAACLALLARPIVQLLLEHGALGGADGRRTAHVLVLLSLWTISGSLGYFLAFAFYGIDRFAGILYFEGAIFLSYLFLAPVLRNSHGVDGLAIAFAIAHAVGVVVGLVVLGPRLRAPRNPSAP
jgi:putative peptidoglycan lipid II flippase